MALTWSSINYQEYHNATSGENLSKFGHVVLEMRADRGTDRHAHHNTLLCYGGWKPSSSDPHHSHAWCTSATSRWKQSDFVVEFSATKTRSIWKMLGPFSTASRRTPIHKVSLPVLSHAACASMSTATTTTTTTRDRGDCYGPMEWAQLFNLAKSNVCIPHRTLQLCKGASVKDVRSKGGVGVGSDADKCGQGRGWVWMHADVHNSLFVTSVIFCSNTDLHYVISVQE